MSSTTLVCFFSEIAQYNLRERQLPYFSFVAEARFTKPWLAHSLNKLFSYFSSISQDFHPHSENIDSSLISKIIALHLVVSNRRKLYFTTHFFMFPVIICPLKDLTTFTTYDLS